MAAALGRRASWSARRCPALLWGVAFANIVAGVPIDADGNFTGNLFTLLNPYGLLGGLAVVALFCTYGAIFVALKTTGDIRVRGAGARRPDRRRGGRARRDVPGLDDAGAQRARWSGRSGC